MAARQGRKRKRNDEIQGINRVNQGEENNEGPVPKKEVGAVILGIGPRSTLLPIYCQPSSAQNF